MVPRTARRRSSVPYLSRNRLERSNSGAVELTLAGHRELCGMGPLRQADGLLHHKVLSQAPNWTDSHRFTKSNSGVMADCDSKVPDGIVSSGAALDTSRGHPAMLAPVVLILLRSFTRFA